MKRIFMTLFILLTMVGLASVSFAAGTAVVSEYSYAKNDSMTIKIAFVGDASDGSVPNTVVATNNLSEAYQTGNYYLYEVWTVAGTGTAPDAADITINDALGAQLFDQDSVLAASGTTEGTVDKYRLITSLMTVVTANQDTASATWDLYIKLVHD
jgi:hypothetical protein